MLRPRPSSTRVVGRGVVVAKRGRQVVVAVVVEQVNRTRLRQNGRVGICKEERKTRKQTRLCFAGQSDHGLRCLWVSWKAEMKGIGNGQAQLVQGWPVDPLVELLAWLRLPAVVPSPSRAAWDLGPGQWALWQCGEQAPLLSGVSGLCGFQVSWPSGCYALYGLRRMRQVRQSP